MNELKKILFILLSTGLIYSNVVLAEEEEPELLTAGELLEGCEEGSVPGAPNQYCMRYVFGLVQYIDAIQQRDQSAPIFCINPEVTRLEEATDTVIGYLRDQTSRSKEEAQILVVESLNIYYPCPAAGRQT